MAGGSSERLSSLIRDLVRDARHTVGLLGPGALPSPLAAALGVLSDEGALRLGRLAQLLGVDPSVASRHVAHAQECGLITRSPDPEDGRAWLLALTDEGRERLAAHRSAREAWLDQALDGWTDDDVAVLLDSLGRFRDDMRAAARGPARRSSRNVAAPVA
jgi:DNA-binding MarR family transcriptional regulator